MRLCYVLLVHHKFDQAVRLMQRLAAPEVDFVVHVDAKVPRTAAESFKARVQGLGRIAYAAPVDVRWGNYDQALAIMRGIEAAVASGFEFDRCVLLSGQDYPIATHAEIVAFFEANPRREFVEADPLDLFDTSVPGWSPHYRFRRFHVWLANRRFTVPLLRKRPPPVKIFHGSTWWALSGDAVRYVAERFKADQGLRRFLRSGFLVDEVYVPSLLMDSGFADQVTHDNVTLAEWAPGSGPHPKTLKVTDIDALLASPRLFARKFDASVDEAVLDKLDAVLASKPLNRQAPAAR